MAVIETNKDRDIYRETYRDRDTNIQIYRYIQQKYILNRYKTIYNTHAHAWINRDRWAYMDDRS